MPCGIARASTRVALVTILGAWLLSSLPWVGAYLRPPKARRLWWASWLVMAALWGLAAIFDGGHYAYLAQRLSAVVFSLARDADEAVGMVWQTYPVLWIGLGFVLWLGLCHLLFGVMWAWAIGAPQSTPWRVRGAEALVVVVGVLVVHGQFSQYPLRWSDAVELRHNFAQSLALNPLHSLQDTWTFRTQRLDDAQMRPDADAVRAFVGLPPLKPGEPVSFLRTVREACGRGAHPAATDVVLCCWNVCRHRRCARQTLGASLRSMRWPREGLLFTRMMSAHGHTARGVFATVTGMPTYRASHRLAQPGRHQPAHHLNEFRATRVYSSAHTSWPTCGACSPPTSTASTSTSRAATTRRWSTCGACPT